MKQTYADFIIGQEEPELLPNEIAYHLTQLLGCEHFFIHNVLIEVNPVLIAICGQWYLPADELLRILPALQARLFPAELLAPLTTPLPCSTSATATA